MSNSSLVRFSDAFLGVAFCSVLLWPMAAIHSIYMMGAFMAFTIMFMVIAGILNPEVIDEAIE